MSVMESRPDRIKRACNRAHARTRALERYGLELRNDDLEWLALRIEANDAGVVPLRPDAVYPSRRLVAVRHAGEWLPAIYDADLRSVVTFIPPHAIDAYRGHLDAVAATLEKAS